MPRTSGPWKLKTCFTCALKGRSNLNQKRQWKIKGKLSLYSGLLQFGFPKIRGAKRHLQLVGGDKQGFATVRQNYDDLLTHCNRDPTISLAQVVKNPKKHQHLCSGVSRVDSGKWSRVCNKSGKIFCPGGWQGLRHDFTAWSGEVSSYGQAADNDETWGFLSHAHLVAQSSCHTRPDGLLESSLFIRAPLNPWRAWPFPKPWDLI